MKGQILYLFDVYSDNTHDEGVVLRSAHYEMIADDIMKMILTEAVKNQEKIEHCIMDGSDAYKLKDLIK